jgi:hypothetical protein
MGTQDGTTPAPQGTRVFFAAGPSVTAGSGGASVGNADGTETFLSTGQPYFRYDGILQPGETSAARRWVFHVDSTVQSFAFVLYVSAPLPDETGRIELSPAAPVITLGGEQLLTATVRSATGAVVAGQPVSWSSSDTSIAKVDTTGNVTGVGLGTATVTATSGPRTGSVTVTVSPSDITAPSLVGLAYAPSSVSASDSVMVTMTASDAGVGVDRLGPVFQSPDGTQHATCTARAPDSGSRSRGTWSCRLGFGVGAAAGTWTLGWVALFDQAGNYVDVFTPDLQAAGIPTTLEVTSPAADVTAPTLDSLAFTPSDVDAADSVTVTFHASDAGTGVQRGGPAFSSPSGIHHASCDARSPVSGTRASGTYACRMGFPAGAEQGTWTLVSMALWDNASNEARLDSAQLAARGMATTLHVTNANQDVTPPALTGLSFTPSTIRGTDSVTVTFSATDAGLGVDRGGAVFESPSGSHASCTAWTPVSGTRANGTFSCTMGLPPAPETGTWTVGWVSIFDRAGNNTLVMTSALQSAGYLVALTVTP